MTVRVLLGVLIFLLDVWALYHVTALHSRRRRVRWIALIVLVPVIGVVLWTRKGVART
jgi:hypothetical protein